MKLNRWFILFTMVVVLSLVSACGGGGGAAQPTATTAPEAGGGQAQPTEAPQPSGEKVQLTLMGWSSSDAENTRLNKIVDDFNSSQDKYVATFNPVPNYDQTLQAGLAGGEPPDVFYLDSFKFPDFIKNDVLEPVNIENPDDFYESLRAGFTANGTFYCPPKDFSTLGLIYNKKMLDDAGVQVPTTWDELKAAAEKLTNKDNNVYGMSLSADAARWLAFLYQAGGHVIKDGKMDIDTPEAKQALEFYTGLILDGYAVTPDEVDAGWNGEAFGKGSVAMTVEGNWIVPYLQDSFPDLEFGIAELPAGSAGKATLAFTVCYAAPKNGKHLDGSQTLINYLTGEQGMQAWTDLGLAMPTRKSLRDHWTQKFPQLETFLAGAEYSHPWQFVAGFSAVTDEINNGIQQIVHQQATVDQALESAQKTGEDVLSSQ